MTSEAALRILMVVEDHADARTVGTLIDKLLLESEGRPSWIDDGLLPFLRHWVDLDCAASEAPAWRHVTWVEMSKRAPRVLGHGIGGPTRDTYAKAARRAIQAAQWADSHPNAVVLVVDADADRERRAGLASGRAAQPSALRVVVGAADPKREAWVLNAFAPRTDEERARLAELCSSLTFNPCSEAHRLRHKRGELRDIKRVLDVLTGGDPEREHEALRSAPLQELASAGEASGLAAFLREAELVVQLLDGPPPRPSE